jgi:predicted nucleic acid-binding protein
MNSLDTNILIYAANSDAPEHAKALAVVNLMLANPSEWILSDQVLWELYKALRHPKILQKFGTEHLYL